MNFRINKSYLLFVLIFTIVSAVLFFSPSFYKSIVRKPPNIALINRSSPTQSLPNEGTLFCFVMTTPQEKHKARSMAVNETWLPRCTHGEFFSTSDLHPSMPFASAFVGMSDDYDALFFKTKWAFYYAYTMISNSFDWYMKTDDDTYIIMEHLYEYLATLDPLKPLYLGYRIREKLEFGHNSGAGYILSNEAVRRFVELAFDNSTICPDDDAEDRGMARCLSEIGIYPHNTLDSATDGTNRFNAYHPSDMFHSRIADSWHFYPPKKGHAWASRYLVSLHHLAPDEIRIIDDLLYRVNSPQFSTYFNRPP